MLGFEKLGLVCAIWELGFEVLTLGFVVLGPALEDFGVVLEILGLGFEVLALRTHAPPNPIGTENAPGATLVELQKCWR